MRLRLTYLKYIVFHILDIETEYALAKSVGKEDTLYPVLNPGRVQSIHMDEQMGYYRTHFSCYNRFFHFGTILAY